MTGKKWVYRFGAGANEGHADMSDLLGKKGANLAEMANIGLPVPPGFTITTDACRNYLENGNKLGDETRQQITDGIAWLEEATARRFGGASRPLLLSVRSGAAQSMPGMMDTVLNLGLNDQTVALLLEQTENGRFVLDCYRRLIQMYGSVVLGLDDQMFDDIVQDLRIQEGLKKDVDIGQQGWAIVIDKYKAAIEQETGSEYPQNINEQFYRTIGAVFRSWFSPRAVSYRAIKGLEEAGGTAVTIQVMVYGNRSENSASGVAFTRNPSTGTPGIYGEYLPRVQGEDIVDGSHSPRALSEAARLVRGDSVASLETSMPQCYRELVEVAERLETRFRDMQEIEFTIEENRLYLLQTRGAKRTIEVAIRVALDLLDEGLISRQEAIERVPLDEFHLLTQPVIDPDFRPQILTRGLPASPGAASGKLVFSAQEAIAGARAGDATILVRNETSPNDVAGMNAARGILTRRGGMTSHAAAIARSIARPCIVDARFIELDTDGRAMRIGKKMFNAGDIITIDGSRGLVMAGEAPMKTPKLDENGLRFKALLEQ